MGAASEAPPNREFGAAWQRLLLLPPLAAPASAKVSHVFAGVFGSASSNPVNPYPLSGPTDVEVDQASHDFYVTDPGNHRVEKFDSAGELPPHVRQWSRPEHGWRRLHRRLRRHLPSRDLGLGRRSLRDAVLPRRRQLRRALDRRRLCRRHGRQPGLEVRLHRAPGQRLGRGWTEGRIRRRRPSRLRACSSGSRSAGRMEISTSAAPTTRTTSGSTPRAGTYEGPIENINSAPWLEADTNGDMYYSAPAEGFFASRRSGRRPSSPKRTGIHDNFQLGTGTPLTGLGFDPSSVELYQDTGSVIDHYSRRLRARRSRPAIRLDSFGSRPSVRAEGRRRSTEPPTPSTSPTRPPTTSRSSADARPIVITGAADQRRPKPASP